MKGRERRRDARRTGLVKLGALWSIIGLTGAGFAAVGVMRVTAPPDAAALCESGTVATSTLVLVDTSDALSDIQRRRVKATIESERDRLRAGGKLTILIMNPDTPGEPLEIFSGCTPGRPEDSNPLFVTRSKIDERWSAAFRGPIDKAIVDASSAPASESSPIIQTIAAAITRPDFDARVPSRQLVIASDMMQYQKDGYSQLRGGDLWKAFQHSGLIETTALDLRGVSVAIDYLVREKYARVQGEKHRSFWQRLFSKAGAAEVTFIGLLPPASSKSAGGLPPSPSPDAVKSGRE